MALCWHEEDVDPSVVYFNIEVGFGRLLMGGCLHGVALTAPIRISAVLACI